MRAPSVIADEELLQALAAPLLAAPLLADAVRLAQEAAAPPTQARARPSSILDRAYWEYCDECEAGAVPDVRSFLMRYPALGSSLAKMIAVHWYFKDHAEVFKKKKVAFPDVGADFLGYRLERILGVGGLSQVYLAREPALGDRAVVVKVSETGHAEALTLGRLDHPNIVPVYSVARDERAGLAVVCMPYLGEATLRDVITRVHAGGVPPQRATAILDAAHQQPAADSLSRSAAAAVSEAVLAQASYVDGVRHLAIQLLDALAYIHREGVYHRDLKPSNVLLTHAGVPMLLDFNLSGDTRLHDNRLGGTPAYASPEQLALIDVEGADASGLDGRTDLFSLGVILYELLSGQHPFVPPPPEMPPHKAKRILEQHHAAGARPIRELNPAVDHPFADLITRCLRRSPAERPENPQAALTLLGPRPAAIRRSRQRRRRLSLVSVLLLVCGIAVAAAAWPVPAVSELQQGQDACRRGELAIAVQHFTRHLEAHEDDAEGWLARGVANLKRQQFALAVVDLKRAQELHPDGPTAACLGFACQKNGQHHPAIFHYCQAIAAGHESAEICNNLGRAHFDTSNMVEAEGSLTRALAINPTLQPPLYNLGLVHLRQAVFLARSKSLQARRDREQFLAAARRDLARALAAGPPSAELYCDAATACAMQPTPDLGLVVEYLSQAVDRGLERQKLEQRPFTTLLKSHPSYLALKQPHQTCTHAQAASEHLLAILPE